MAFAAAQESYAGSPQRRWDQFDDLLVGRSGAALIFDGKLHPHLGNDLAIGHLRSPPAQGARMYR